MDPNQNPLSERERTMAEMEAEIDRFYSEKYPTIHKEYLRTKRWLKKAKERINGRESEPAV